MNAPYSNMQYTLESGMGIWYADHSSANYEWFEGPGWYAGHEVTGNYGPFATAQEAEDEAEKIAAYY